MTGGMSWRCGAPQHPGGPTTTGRAATEILETAASLIATSGLRTSIARHRRRRRHPDRQPLSPLRVEGSICSSNCVRRYHDDLDRVARPRPPHARRPDLSSRVRDRSSSWAPRLRSAPSRIAPPSRSRCTRHRAPTPSRSSGRSSGRSLSSRRCYQTLRAARWSGHLRSDVDLRALADRICQTMMHVGLDVIAAQRHNRPGRESCCAESCWTGWRPAVRPTPNSTSLRRSWPRSGHSELDRRASRGRRQGRPCPGGRAGPVRTQRLRSHHDPRHRSRQRDSGTARCSVDRFEGRTSVVDHGVVRQEGRRRIRQRSSHRSDTRRETRCADLDQYQRPWSSSPTSGRYSLRGCVRSPPDTPNPESRVHRSTASRLKSLLSEGIRANDHRHDSAVRLRCCRAA